MSKGYDFLGDRIRKLREINNCTQEELGKLLNLPKQSISRIEKGNRKISIEELDNIADFFGTAPIVILKDDLIDKKYEDNKPKNRWGFKVPDVVDFFLDDLEEYFNRLLDMDERFSFKNIKKDINETKRALDRLLKEYDNKKQ